MTDEKICPIMSRPVSVVLYKESGIVRESFIPCQREKCMAWEKGDDCLKDPCPKPDAEFSGDPCKGCEHHVTGWCVLIERGAV